MVYECVWREYLNDVSRRGGGDAHKCVYGTMIGASSRRVVYGSWVACSHAHILSLAASICIVICVKQ